VKHSFNYSVHPEPQAKSIIRSDSYGILTSSTTLPLPLPLPMYAFHVNSILFWGPPNLLSNGYRGLFPGCKADHSPPSSAEVKNVWRYYLQPLIRLYGVVLREVQGQLYFTLPYECADGGSAHRKVLNSKNTYKCIHTVGRYLI
jgi:hypothetical protein